jgi:uncharacterized membrane protein HdeD (DUF308 family)
MTEDNENVQVSVIDSKFNRIALTLISVVLIFVGPTYIPGLLADTLKVDYVASILVGVVLLIVGLVMLVYLYRKKVIT